MLKVEVAYASQESYRVISIDVTAQTTLLKAIIQSGICEVYPEIDLLSQEVGVFGELKQLTDFANNGDRIEIYRPLAKSAIESRREKVALARKLKRRHPSNLQSLCPPDH